jgi:hypothetical protein
MFMEKPSCIQELKDLTSKLTDRDISLKSCFKEVKSIVNCKEISDKEKISKIKKICNGRKQ